MRFDRRQLLAFLSAGAVSPLLAGQAGATNYPTRPVRVMLGFPAGGGADVLTRLMADWLQSRLGQPFVVENRPGAATNLATEAVVRSQPDGYTLLATTTSNLINGALFADLKFDFIRDIAPIACLSTQPLVLTTIKTVPASSVTELVAYAKANPGKLNMGHFGTATISHLAAEAFRQATGIEAVIVPYRGSPQMVTDMLGGRIHVAFDNIPGVIEHLRSDSLRALGVTTLARSNALPSVPTVGETITGFEAFTVAGLGAPKGTPVEIIDRLNAEVNAGLADPKLRSRLTDLGATLQPGSAADFAALIRRETEKWAKVIKTSGIQAK